MNVLDNASQRPPGRARGSADCAQTEESWSQADLGPHLNLLATSGSYEYFVFLVGGFSLVFGIPQISHCFPPL